MKSQEAKITTRAIPRKGKNPEAHRKDFNRENVEFGVKNEVDLVLEHIAGQKIYNSESAGFLKAKGLYDRQMINYSADAKVTKEKKKETYLTV
jgi:hypothetical protein